MRAPSLAIGLLLGAVLASLVAATLPEPAPHEPSQQEIVDAYHKLFYHGAETWKLNTWMGIPCFQNPNDVWIIQEIISEQEPDLIVETGTLMRGSATLWATILAQVNPEGRVVSIDIEDPETKAEDFPPIRQLWHRKAEDLPVVQERVEFLIGSSTDPEIVAEVARRAEGRKVLVILDSLHRKEHVLEEMRLYGPLVQVGGYMVVQDTDINGHPVFEEYGPGPWEAVEAFLAEDERFEPDPWRERLLFTMHPRGYLKRVR